jgi:hypothetical protein
MWYDALFSGSAAWFGIPAVLGTAFFMLRTALGFLGVFSDVGDSVGHHDVPHDVPHDIPHDVPHDLPHDAPMGETPLAHHADVPHHPAGHGQASHAAPLVTAAEIFSVQSLAAFAGAFGWAGLIGREHFGAFGGALIGLVAGVSVAAGVITIFRQFRKFESDGTITLADMLGLEATVYVRIPARDSGSGQIRVEVRGAERFVSAISRDALIPTGTRVLILAANPDNSVVVQSLAEPAEVTQAPLHQPPSAQQRPALEQGES